MTRALSRLPRCVRCRMPLYLCICRHVRPVPTETRVLVLTDARESHKPTNSGHLARLLLPAADVRVVDGERDLSPTWLAPGDDGSAALLFPREDALDLEVPSFTPPLTLVVPDAPWKRARRMAKRWALLRGLPAVRLPEGPPRTFHLRKTRLGAHALGTLEAIARAMGVLESQYVEDQIHAVHRRVVLRGLYMRGRAAADDELLRELSEAQARGLELP